jgi:hypothetical protein
MVGVSAPHGVEKILSRNESGEPLHNKSGEPLSNYSGEPLHYFNGEPRHSRRTINTQEQRTAKT